jgi:hypothetical protein
MGGTNKQDNLVWLTAEEHYVAHQLLVKMYPDNYKLIYAANMMCTNSPTGQRNNKLYGWLRSKLKNGPNGFKKGGSPWNKGKIDNYTEETLSKMSKAKKGVPGHDSEKLNKTYEELYGEEKAKAIKSKCTSNGFKGKTARRLSCIVCRKETNASSLSQHHKHLD